MVAYLYINPLTRRPYLQVLTHALSAARAGSYIVSTASSLVPFYSAYNGLQTSTKHIRIVLAIQNKMADSVGMVSFPRLPEYF